MTAISGGTNANARVYSTQVIFALCHSRAVSYKYSFFAATRYVSTEPTASGANNSTSCSVSAVGNFHIVR